MRDMHLLHAADAVDNHTRPVPPASLVYSQRTDVDVDDDSAR